MMGWIICITKQKSLEYRQVFIKRKPLLDLCRQYAEECLQWVKKMGLSIKQQNISKCFVNFSGNYVNGKRKSFEIIDQIFQIMSKLCIFENYNKVMESFFKIMDQKQDYGQNQMKISLCNIQLQQHQENYINGKKYKS
ncbi:unnamed protein product [Paramecium sonneborni]|uniref:Uncharacterized protein n=1 Tax=Paramecium sonneborni TaxID=65129 RepID=A0A8S1RSN9_9CILI|nr:unnamed protein product [Paramecium sonneborni]